MDRSGNDGSLDARLRAIEDRLEIYDLIASHPPSADTGADYYTRVAFAEDGSFDRGEGLDGAVGNEAIAAMTQTPGHQRAIAGGLAHFTGLPHIAIDGDTASVTSYLQLLHPDPRGDVRELPNHGIRRAIASTAWSPTGGSCSGPPKDGRSRAANCGRSTDRSPPATSSNRPSPAIVRRIEGFGAAHCPAQSTAAGRRDFRGRLEDGRLLRGRGRYTDDLSFGGELHGVVVRSTHPSAGLRRIDIAAARRVDGVAGIVTGEDLARDGIGDLPFMSTIDAPGGGPVRTLAMPLLARGVVRHVGEPIAFAVAESLPAAEDAAGRVVIDYAPQDHVTDILAAAADGAPRVQEGSGNVVGELRMGDAAACRAALAGARHRFVLRLRNNRIAPHPMEPRAAIGLYDAAGASWTLHCASQAPHHGRAILADAVFGVPRERIRVRVGDIGGAFGGRVTPYPEDGLVLYAARRFGRPVRWRAERSESFLGDYHARDHAAEIELGLDDALGIVALRIVDHASLGAYATPFGIPISTTTGNRIATGAYRVPVADIAVRTVLANTTPTGPYRGAGRPEANHRIERILDFAASRLGVDPVGAAPAQPGAEPRAALPGRVRARL